MRNIEARGLETKQSNPGPTQMVEMLLSVTNW